MSKEAATEANGKRVGRRILFWLIVALLVAPLAFYFVFLTEGIAVVKALVAGWLTSPARVLPALELDAANWLAWATCFVSVLAITSWFLFFRSNPKAAGLRRAEGRWAALAIGMTVLVCGLLFSAVGVAHAASILLTTTEPLQVYKGGGRKADHIIGVVLGEAKLVAGVSTPQGLRVQADLRDYAIQRYRVLMLVDPNDRYQGLVVIPRREAYGYDVIAICDGNSSRTMKLSQMDEISKLYGHRLRPIW